MSVIELDDVKEATQQFALRVPNFHTHTSALLKSSDKKKLYKID